MGKSKRQKYLEEELRKEKNRIHNKVMMNNAQIYRKELIQKATLAEKMFAKALLNSPLSDKYEFQHIIYYKVKGKIEKFYITDFCLPEIKLIIELDGEYHYTNEQKAKDSQRTKELKKLGYKVYRFKNSQILGSKNLPGLIRWIMKNIL